MKIIVKPLSGKKIELDVESNEKVINIKRKIEAITRFSSS